jgi:hypothetical protein
MNISRRKFLAGAIAIPVGGSLGMMVKASLGLPPEKLPLLLDFESFKIPEREIFFPAPHPFGLEKIIINDLARTISKAFDLHSLHVSLHTSPMSSSCQVSQYSEYARSTLENNEWSSTVAVFS